MHPDGMNRIEAAAFVSARTGRRLGHTVLRYWEAVGVLEKRGRGRRTPVRYGVRDLVAACLVAELRATGASLQKVRKAREALRRLWPELDGRPGAHRFAVKPNGELVRVSESGRELTELTRQTGQLAAWFMLWDAGSVTREARAAVAGVVAA